MIVTDPRMAAGSEPMLVGKPAVLVTVRGGNYRPGTLVKAGTTPSG